MRKHPLRLTRGRQADALRKLIKSYQPEAKDCTPRSSGMSVGLGGGRFVGFVLGGAIKAIITGYCCSHMPQRTRR